MSTDKHVKMIRDYLPSIARHIPDDYPADQLKIRGIEAHLNAIEAHIEVLEAQIQGLEYRLTWADRAIFFSEEALKAASDIDTWKEMDDAYHEAVKKSRDQLYATMRTERAR